MVAGMFSSATRSDKAA